MSDYLGGLSSSYLNTSYNSYNQGVSELENSLKDKDFSTASEEELMDACKEFEKYFIEQAFKGMEKMIPKSDDDDTSNSYLDMFKDKLYEEYASDATERGDGIGIAKMLYEQMKRNYDL